MLATLGGFVFELKTVPYQQLQRSNQWRWSENARTGRRPAAQYLGPGEDAITLSGSLYPELTGGSADLDTLRAMAGEGKSFTFIDGEGHIYGLWFIVSIRETRSVLDEYGSAKKIEFEIGLKRADDTQVEDIARLEEMGVLDAAA